MIYTVIHNKCDIRRKKRKNALKLIGTVNISEEVILPRLISEFADPEGPILLFRSIFHFERVLLCKEKGSR